MDPVFLTAAILTIILIVIGGLAWQGRDGGGPGA